MLSVTEHRGIVPQTEVFRKRIATTDTAKYKVMRPLDIAFNPYLLWTGAVGQWLESDPGVTSPVYECFRVREPHDARFIGLLLESGMLTNYFDGTAIGSIKRRRRTTVPVFLAAPVDIPEPGEQRRIVDLIDALDAVVGAVTEEMNDVQVARCAWRAERFRDLDARTLSEVCSIDARLVDPRDDQYCDMQHIGVERIERNTGQQLELRTAREEGLISGKYLFDQRDVVLAKIRPNLRKVCVPGFIGLCSADAYPLTPIPDLPPEALLEALLTPEVTDAIVARSSRTKMPKVNRAELMSVEVPLGSEPSQWARIAEESWTFARLSEAGASELVRLKELRGELLSALLSGEVELPATYGSLLESA